MRLLGSKYLLFMALTAVFILLSACGQAKQDGAKQTNEPSKAAEKKALDRIKEKGKLSVGVKSDYAPFGSIDEKGKNVGFEIELAHRFAKELFGDPDKVEFTPVNSTNRVPFLQTGKIDLIIATMSVTEERAKEVDFSESYFKSGVQLLVKKESNINDVPDLKGKKVVVVPGSSGDLGIAKLVPEAEAVKLQKTSEAVQALKDGRAEAFAYDNTFLYPFAGQYPEFKVVGKPFSEQPWAIAVKKGDSDVVEWVNKNLQKWESEDYFYEIYKKWIEKEVPKEFNPSDFLRRPKK